MILHFLAWLVVSTAQANSFSPTLTQRVQQIVSVFENSTKVIQYDYIENIRDGRGYTAGEAGFTTGTGDLVLVAEKYVALKADPSWKSLLPLLRKLAAQGSGDVSGLKNLPALWRQASNDNDFIRSQDGITDQLYRAPARRELDRYGFVTPLAYLIFYDTMIQNGDGDDPDSFNGVVSKMKSRPSNETEFLKEFLIARAGILLNPTDQSSAQAWRESVDRVYALQRLIINGNWQLALPFDVQVWGNNYSF